MPWQKMTVWRSICINFTVANLSSSILAFNNIAIHLDQVAADVVELPQTPEHDPQKR